MQNRLVWAFIVCIAVLFWFFGKSCGDVIDTRAQAKIDSIVRQTEAEKQVYRKAVDSLGEKVDTLTRDLVESGRDLIDARRKAKSAEDKAAIAIAKYEQAKLTTDTSAMLTFCDDFVQAHRAYVIQVNEERAKADSVIDLQYKVMNNQKQVIHYLTKQNTSAYEKIDLMAAEFKGEHNLRVKAEKKKGNFWKGLGVGAAATLAAILASK